MIGDGENNVTLANLNMFGFNPVVIANSKVQIEKNHIFSSRYDGRDVSPFWFLNANINLDKVNRAKMILELSDSEFYSAYKDFKFSELTPPNMMLKYINM